MGSRTRAGLANDIEQMPMGMHTFVTEGGGTFSAASDNGILIARALVTKPENTASSTKQQAPSIIERNRSSRKASIGCRSHGIVVAHRLSTFAMRIRVYVMDDGHVVQSGTVEELAAQDGLFRRMIARQIGVIHSLFLLLSSLRD